MLLLFIGACGASAGGEDPLRSTVTPTPPPLGGPCPVTTPPPLPLAAPPDVNFLPDTTTFGYGNATLYVVLPRDATLRPDPYPGTTERGVKFGWWRLGAGELVIATRRLDASTPPLAASIPRGYGTSGFQVSGLRFAAPDCWEVSAAVGGQAPLAFVVRVESR